MRRSLFFLAFLAAAAANAQTVDWTRWDPMAIRSDRTAAVTLQLQTSGPGISAVRLDYAAGGSISLTPTSPNLWSASVPAAKVLEGYQSDDVNHNVVGFVRLLGGSGQTLASLNSVIHVIDSRVAAAAVRNLPSNARATSRILNLWRPGINPDTVPAAVQQLYGYFHDDYDFVQVVYTQPSYPANRYHFAVRNSVTGIGQSAINNGAQYGSATKLIGITVFPVDSFFDTAESAFSHELGHQWIMFLKNASLSPGTPHWVYSTMARNLMGFSIPGSGAGGEFQWLITPVTATTARTTSASPTQEFGDLDLYLMGFLPASQVPPQTIITGEPCQNCVLPSSTLTINDVIAVNGARTPDSLTAKKSFRIATVVISRDRLLTDDEMSILEYFAARGESDSVLPFTSGLARGTTKPFSLATRGIGRVDFRLETTPRHRAVQHR